jgi:hypothetical protein
MAVTAGATAILIVKQLIASTTLIDFRYQRHFHKTVGLAKVSLGQVRMATTFSQGSNQD